MTASYKTFVVIRVSLPYADNTPECRNRDGSPLSTLIHKEIYLPPLFAPNMLIGFDDGISEKVAEIYWHSDQRILELFGDNEIVYWGQGSDSLTSQDKIIAFYDSYLQDYLDCGWTIGNPHIEKEG